LQYRVRIPPRLVFNPVTFDLTLSQQVVQIDREFGIHAVFVCLIGNYYQTTDNLLFFYWLPKGAVNFLPVCSLNRFTYLSIISSCLRTGSKNATDNSCCDSPENQVIRSRYSCCYVAT